jgi:hypothetical protein
LKALPPVEHDDVDPDGAVATIVEDSDDEQSAPTSVFTATVPTPAPTPVVQEVKVDEPAKKKIVRKKTDA